MLVTVCDEESGIGRAPEKIRVSLRRRGTAGPDDGLESAGGAENRVLQGSVKPWSTGWPRDAGGR